MNIKYGLILGEIQRDPRYLDGITYGEPRPGHPEGTVKAHIEELLRALYWWMDYPDDNFNKLRILIHVHDTFKKEGHRLSEKPVALSHPHSHTSLGAAYLRSLGGMEELAQIVQYHDEIFALYKKYLTKGAVDYTRLEKVKLGVDNLELYFDFVRRDSSTPGKRRSPDWNDFQEFITRIEGLLGSYFFHVRKVSFPCDFIESISDST